VFEVVLIKNESLFCKIGKKERKWRANNPNFVINPLRLSIRGLPWDVDRAVLSNHIRQFVMKECNLDKAGVRKIIDQVIVVKQKKDAYAQSGEQRRSAGYGFASFHDHEIAKKVLKHFNGNDNPGWKKQGNNGLRPIVEFTLDDKRKLRQQEDAKAKLKSALDRQAKEKGFKSAEEMLGKEQLDKATALKKSKSQRKKEKKLSRGQKQREKRRQQKAAAEAEAKEAQAALANKKSKKVKKTVAKNAETPQVKKDTTKLALEGKKNKTAKEKLLLQKLNVLAGDAAALNKMTKISEKKDAAKKKPPATAKAAKNVKSDKKALKEQEQKRKLQQEFAEIGAPTGDHIPRKKRKAMLEEARKSKKKKMASIDDFEANRFASYN
jgi:RNA recognition motif-containing protein